MEAADGAIGGVEPQIPNDAEFRADPNAIPPVRLKLGKYYHKQANIIRGCGINSSYYEYISNF